MFAITADQIGSRARSDLAGPALEAVAAIGGDRLAMPPDRTAGDEIQAATDDAGTALRIVLHLTRDGLWRVGLGVGDVRPDRPTAHVLARDALDAAAKSPTRFALSIDEGRLPDAVLLQPLLDLLLQLRDRRTPEGWVIADLLAAGRSQAQAAAELGITPQAVSLRVQHAHLHTERAAIASLTELLEAAGEPPQG